MLANLADHRPRGGWSGPRIVLSLASTRIVSFHTSTYKKTLKFKTCERYDFDGDVLPVIKSLYIIERLDNVAHGTSSNLTPYMID
jgi:hypothetical protein